MLVTFTVLIHFKNKHYLNKDVLLLLCLLCILDMYILVLNKLTLSIALKLSFSPKIVLISISVSVLKVSLVIKDSNIVMLRCS
jgi:hypothetical protein